MLKRINLRYLGLLYKFRRREHFHWQVIQGTEKIFSFWFLRHTALAHITHSQADGKVYDLMSQYHLVLNHSASCSSKILSLRSEQV